MNEAKVVKKDLGSAPEGEGWFVLNAARASWYSSPKFGSFTLFEDRKLAPFAQVGVNLHVLEPGRPNCHYHAESDQEDFLVHDLTLAIVGRHRFRPRAPRRSRPPRLLPPAV